MINYPCVDNYTGFYQQSYTSNNISLQSHVSVYLCRTLCDNTDKCTGFNYLWDLKVCELLTDDYFIPNNLELTPTLKNSFYMRSFTQCENEPFPYYFIFFSIFMILIIIPTSYLKCCQKKTATEEEEAILPNIPPSYEETLNNEREDTNVSLTDNDINMSLVERYTILE